MTFWTGRMIERQSVVPTTDIQPAGDLSANQTTMVQELRCGDLCPQCHAAQLDYDGLLNLDCPLCGYSMGGCFT